MRKLFRMKYESCHGGCYTADDVLEIHSLGLDVQGAVVFLRRLLLIHGLACGNDRLGYRLDVDDARKIYVASFERYGAFDLFLDETPAGALDQLIEAALTYYASQEYAQNLKAQRKLQPCTGFRGPEDYRDHLPCTACEPGSDCRHGQDNKLIEFALKFSGLDATTQAQVRLQLAS